MTTTATAQLGTAPGAAYITFDDVQALYEQDPTVSAARVRAALGRGSLSTIQRHLDTLRAAAAPAPVAPALDTAPPAPQAAQALVQSLFQLAHSHAQSQVLALVQSVTADRDAALVRAAALADDVYLLQSQCDESDAAAGAAIAQAQAAVAVAAEAQAQAQACTAAAAAAAAEAASAAEAVAREREREREQAAAAAALAEAGRDLMRQELARLTDQIGELKAHLYKRADAAAASDPAG